ncbi:helix-turn-helix domain-containing protein [Sorangium sp. So ce233]|uniref:helix-turn-helix domain-containing protein n=1 Tax=Sorangium sp. So ce233 TaxID=3133290 RepID=UPI003F5DA16F
MEGDHADAVLEYIGANVHRHRVRLGLTQDALAEAAEISTGFLQRVERGKTNVGVVVLVRLADALGVEPGVLLRRATMPEVTRGRPPRSPRAKRQPSR